MPTPNPRLSVTLTPELAAILERLSEVTGSSKSSLVAELLLTSQPVFTRMAEALEAAARMKGEALTGNEDIAKGLLRAQERIEGQLGLCLDEMDTAFLPILKESEKVIRRARATTAGGVPHGGGAGAGAGSTPVPVTRGLGGAKSPENRTVKGVRRG